MSWRCAFCRKDDFKSSHNLRHYIKKYKERYQTLLVIQTDASVINEVIQDVIKDKDYIQIKINKTYYFNSKITSELFDNEYSLKT